MMLKNGSSAPYAWNSYISIEFPDGQVAHRIPIESWDKQVTIEVAREAARQYMARYAGGGGLVAYFVRRTRVKFWHEEAEQKK